MENRIIELIINMCIAKAIPNNRFSEKLVVFARNEN